MVSSWWPETTADTYWHGCINLEIHRNLSMTNWAVASGDVISSNSFWCARNYLSDITPTQSWRTPNFIQSFMTRALYFSSAFFLCCAIQLTGVAYIFDFMPSHMKKKLALQMKKVRRQEISPTVHIHVSSSLVVKEALTGWNNAEEHYSLEKCTLLLTLGREEIHSAFRCFGSFLRYHFHSSKKCLWYIPLFLYTNT